MLPADLCAETDKTGIQVNEERRNPRQVEVIRQCFGVIGVAGGERNVTVAPDIERRIAGSVELHRLPAQGHRRGVIVPEEQNRPATRIDRQTGDGIGGAAVDIRRTIGSQGQTQVGEIVVAPEEFREVQCGYRLVVDRNRHRGRARAADRRTAGSAQRGREVFAGLRLGVVADQHVEEFVRRVPIRPIQRAGHRRVVRSGRG